LKKNKHDLEVNDLLHASIVSDILKTYNNIAENDCRR